MINQLKKIFNKYKLLRLFKKIILTAVHYLNYLINNLFRNSMEKKILMKDNLKLNLGCCTSKVSGFINIDLDKSVNPDVLDNVIILKKFRDNSVNEIKSAHLIEHLPEEDALGAISNWYRILKSGGIVSIECPNLNKCIKMIHSNDTEEKKLGFVGIYGYMPHVKQSAEFHSHKHGWTPYSLCEALENNGFINTKEIEIEQKFRCYNQRYDRDMRIVAKKPY